MDVQHNRITHVRTGLSVTGSLDQIQLSNNSFFDVTGCIGATPDYAGTVRRGIRRTLRKTCDFAEQ